MLMNINASGHLWPAELWVLKQDTTGEMQKAGARVLLARVGFILGSVEPPGAEAKGPASGGLTAGPALRR